MPFMMQDFYNTGILKAESEMAQEKAKVYPQLLQQEMQLTGAKAESEKMDVEQKRRAINIQDNIARMLGQGRQDDGQTATDAVGSLEKSSRDLSLLVNAYEKAGDLQGAEKLRKDLIGVQEHLVTAKERAIEHQTKNLDGAIAKLQLVADDPSKLAAAKLAIIAEHQLSPDQLQYIGAIDTPQKANEARKSLMSMKDQIATKQRDDQLKEERRRAEETERHNRAMEAKSERAAAAKVTNQADKYNKAADTYYKEYMRERDRLHKEFINPDNKKRQEEIVQQEDDLKQSFAERIRGLQRAYPDLNVEMYDPGAKPQSKYTETNPAKVNTKEEFAKLPSGAVYVNPADGKLYKKK